MVTARLVLLLKLRSFEPEVLISRDHLLTLKILKTNPGKVKQFLNKTAILYGQTAQEHIFKFWQAVPYCKKQEKNFTMAVNDSNLRRLIELVAKYLNTQITIQMQHPCFHESLVKFAVK